MIKLGKIKGGTRVVDLGSGDGRLVIEAAKKGAQALGVEINPGLWVYSLLRKFLEKKQIQGSCQFKLMSLYNVDYSKYDVIFVAGFIEMMKKLEKMLEKGLSKGTLVICYAFPLPTKIPVTSSDGIYVYKY